MINKQFIYSNFHHLSTLVGCGAESVKNNEAQPEVNANMEPQGNMQAVSDFDFAGHPEHVPHMWPLPLANHEKQLDACISQQFEPTTPLVDFDRK